METAGLGEKGGESTDGGPGAELKPKDAVRRILAASGAALPDKEAFWLGCHMERFVNYTRKHGEHLEFPLAVECYLTFFKQGNPPEWQLDQVKQALVLFGRGTERWRWVRVDQNDPTGSSGLQVQAGSQGYVLRYRVKASGVNDTLVSAQGEVSPLGPPVEMAAWIEDLRRALRVSHYSIRTEQTYIEHLRRFLIYTGPVATEGLGEKQVQRYLEYLALTQRVAASSQNQAFSALLFFFKRVLVRPLGNMEETARARRGSKLPVVLGRDEVTRLLAVSEGTSGLMMRLLYGAGLRLQECIRLRVKEVDFERGVIFVRDGKGGKDRAVMLPQAVRAGLAQHLG